MWETIGNIIKTFHFSYDYVLWNLSYQNLQMLLVAQTDTTLYDEEDEENNGNGDQRDTEEEAEGFDSIAGLQHLFGS